MRSEAELQRIWKEQTEAPLAFQHHLTIRELAHLWQMSDSTILRLFSDEDDVVRLGNMKSRKRTKISLRIPVSVAIRVHAELTRKT